MEFKTSNHLSGREGKVIEYTKTQSYKVIADCFGKKDVAALFAAAPDLEKAVKLQGQAIEELMREYVSKKGGAADWSIINDAGLAANAALAKIKELK